MKIETSLFASLASTTLASGVHQLNFTRALRSIGTPLGSTSEVEGLKSFEGTLTNHQYYYSLDIQVGTPAQTISVDIDTGSSDLFVNAAENTGCDQDCHSFGTFDSSSSSTYSLINNGFSVEYGDRSKATGNWVKDNVEVGDNDIPLTFAVATDSSTGQGVFGIGYASLGGGGSGISDYINYPRALVKAGVINSQTYSIYLNSLDADSGSILFGGVDQTKYTGTLGTVPLTSSSRTLVTLNNLQLSDGSYISSSVGDVLLDTGTTLTYLPNDFIDGLVKLLGGTSSDDGHGNTIYTVPCESSSRTLDFTFGCVTVKVPFSNFQSSLSSGSCSLDLIPAGDGLSIVGDSFLRSAYIVFDLDNQQASIAQASLNGSGSDNIQVIPTTPNSVPGATVCSA